MTFLRLLTIAVIIILPLFPLQLDTRIIFVIAGFALILSPVFIKNFTQDFEKRKLVTIFFLLFLGASTLSTIFSIDRERSLFTLLVYFSSFVIFTSIRTIFPNFRSKLLLTTIYLLLTTVLSAISLYNTLILNYVNREPIGVSFMWIYYGHNHLANLLLFAIPLSIYLWKVKPFHHLHSTYYILLTTFYLVTLFFTFGLTSMGSLALAIIVLLLFWKEKIQKKILWAVLISLVLAAFSVGAASINRDFGLRKKIVLSFQNRVTYLHNGIDNFLKRPWIGSGLDTYRFVNKESKRKVKLQAHYGHNFPIQMLSDAGILGFLSSIGLIGAVLWQTLRRLLDIRNLKLEIRNLYIALFTGLVASTINSLVDFDWQLPYVFLIFWLFAGILLHSDETKKLN